MASVCVICGCEWNGRVKVRLGDAHLAACRACHSWIFFPRPTQEKQSGIHDNPGYFEHPYFKLRRDLDESQRRRCRELFARLEGALDLGELRGCRMLDVGCDTGTLLAAARKEFGIVPFGVDVNRNAIRIASAIGVAAYCGTLETMPASLSDFSLITAVDLIEHVADPRAFLAELRNRLTKGGLAYLETPNIRSAVYGIGRVLSILTGGRPGALFDRLFPAQHIQYFTRASLTALVRAAGLEVVELRDRPLPLPQIAASVPVRAAMGVMQVIDIVRRERILVWAVIRRPAASARNGRGA
jgi:2-polyprenyl-3-methyl-5-hydroxy-6-metoxy-1,4-benzoquinol methylase